MGVTLKDEVLEAVQHRDGWCALSDVYDQLNRHVTAGLDLVWAMLVELEGEGQLEIRTAHGAVQWRAVFEGSA